MYNVGFVVAVAILDNPSTLYFFVHFESQMLIGCFEVVFKIVLVHALFCQIGRTARNKCTGKLKFTVQECRIGKYL